MPKITTRTVVRRRNVRRKKLNLFPKLRRHIGKYVRQIARAVKFVGKDAEIQRSIGGITYGIAYDDQQLVKASIAKIRARLLQLCSDSKKCKRTVKTIMKIAGAARIAAKLYVKAAKLAASA